MSEVEVKTGHISCFNFCQCGHEINKVKGQPALHGNNNAIPTLTQNVGIMLWNPFSPEANTPNIKRTATKYTHSLASCRSSRNVVWRNLICFHIKINPAMFPERLSRFICHFYYRDSKFCGAKSLLICRCSNRKWHFKEPSDGGTYNATKCKPPFQQDLPLSSSLSHHPGFTVTTTWHSRLSANINSTLCCSVVSTMPNGTLARNPSTVTVGGGTSNSIAAATFIEKAKMSA